MPKSFNQKLKILYLMQALWKGQNSEHPMSVPDFILYLEGYGISVERPSEACKHPCSEGYACREAYPAKIRRLSNEKKGERGR